MGSKRADSRQQDMEGPPHLFWVYFFFCHDTCPRIGVDKSDALAVAQEKAREANNKYFSEMSGFLKVGKKEE